MLKSLASNNVGEGCYASSVNVLWNHHLAIEDGEVLEGELPKSKVKLVQAWLEIHREDLTADWNLAVQGLPPQRIKPLD